MSVIVTKQRYNWMGYNGTETEEVDTALLRAEGATGDNYSYDHRQQVIAELKERLYQIKRDLDLLPEEELRAEEENRQRRRAERKRREEEERQRRAAEEAARAEEEERQRIEQEEREEQRRQDAEEQERLRQEQEAEAQKNAERWRQLHGDSDDDSDVEEEQNEALSGMPRTQEEIDYAAGGFAKGTRMLLAANGQGYVSYLDGSVHPSIEKLEAHNEEARAAAEAAVAGSSVSVPPAEEYSLDEVRAAAAHHQQLRKKVDAYRALQDPTYSARVRASEKNINGQPAMAITAEDGDEAAMSTQLEEAKQHSEEVRKTYNARAAASGNAIAGVACSRAGVVPPTPPAAEAVVAPAEEAAAAPEAVRAVSPEELSPKAVEATSPEELSPSEVKRNEAEAAAQAQEQELPPAAAEENMEAGEAPLSDKKPTPKSEEDEL